jgi:SURF4 family.
MQLAGRSLLAFMYITLLRFEVTFLQVTFYSRLFQIRFKNKSYELGALCLRKNKMNRYLHGIVVKFFRSIFV